jgi:hypothetical protein
MRETVKTKSLVDSIATRLRSERSLDAPTLHRLRRGFSKVLALEDAATVIAIAHRLLELPRVPGARMIACGLVGNHPAALSALDAEGLERLGEGLASWADVDIFGCLVAGRAWREGSIADKTIHRWARSSDRWWRRAALVATVPLNVRSQGGRGDTPRTLGVCELLAPDRDDMVVKGLSWALRGLATRDRDAVAEFVRAHEDVLAARVKREVMNKLETGLKNPTSGDVRTKRKATAKRAAR